MLIGDKLLPEGYNIKQLYTVSIPQNISLSAQTFLLSMLQINKEKRLSCAQLLKHEFITNDKNSVPIEFDIPSELYYKSDKKVINNLNISSNIPLDNFRKKIINKSLSNIKSQIKNNKRSDANIKTFNCNNRSNTKNKNKNDRTNIKEFYQKMIKLLRHLEYYQTLKCQVFSNFFGSCLLETIPT